MKNQKEFEESIISTLKAMSEIDKIAVDFDSEVNFAAINQNYFLPKNISLPPISSLSDKNKLDQVRAFADLAALYLKFHNPQIHPQNFGNEQSQKLFDDFEKFRLIKYGSDEFKGIAVNLEKTLADNLNAINDYSFLPFLLLSDLSGRNLKLVGRSLFSKLQSQINTYKKTIDPDLLEKVRQLENLVSNQKAFASKALELIEFLNNQEQKNNKKEEGRPENQSDAKLTPQDQVQNQESSNEENIEREVQIENQTSQSEGEQNKEEKFLEQSIQSVPNVSEIEDLDSNQPEIKFVPEYKIFTKKFDQTVKADDLINADDLENLRHQLDLKLAKQERISKQLTAKLKRKLLAKKQIFFEFNKEEGLLDRKKISQIIARPLSGNNYLTVREDDYQNTVLSILLDNSGSMRGTPIVTSAMAAEIIAKIFEGFGIKTEILGFTTVDWRGGQARKLWEECGKPKNPGRLSDLRHIIYKHADQSFKKSKNNLALMLKDGILKENIDGEALIWASTRLKNRSEKRRILLVISDGTPVDDSTNSNNEGDILSDHLHQTIHRLEKHSKIEIAAIGIGHNVGDFYHNSITVKNIAELGDVMINKICDLL